MNIPNLYLINYNTTVLVIGIYDWRADFIIESYLELKRPGVLPV